MGKAQQNQVHRAKSALTGLFHSQQQRLSEIKKTRRSLATKEAAIDSRIAEYESRVNTLGEAAKNWRTKYNAETTANAHLSESLAGALEKLELAHNDIASAHQRIDELEESEDELAYALEELMQVAKRWRAVAWLGLTMAAAIAAHAIAVSQGYL